VGYDSADDAAVYDLQNGMSLISTADFFPPMVDDPYTFGKIAAANALSDVYAMGGRPVMALNLVCFPQALPKGILAEILRGGAEKLMEAGAVLAGGHSIYDKEIKYGLSVTGLVENAKLLRNNTPRLGDALILTKPLGTGLIMAAHRVGQASETDVAEALLSMETLNKYAAERLKGFNISACTDITGFGLACHGLEMAGDGASFVINTSALPILPGALEYAGDFLITAAGQRNRLHAGNAADADNLSFAMQELVFDPQTSGGLLIAVAAEEAGTLLESIKKDCPRAAVIGSVVKHEQHSIIFRW
jgi:selenide,water dikinase